MTRFIGIDLAWSDRNLTGFAVLDRVESSGAVRMLESGLLHTDDDIRTAVNRASGAADALLAIDAPIIAPNPTGTSRDCDRAVSRDFGRFHAGAYPANQVNSERPVRLRKALEVDGFSPDPTLPDRGAYRRQLEIFPHPAHVVLFKRQRIIKYKKGTVAQRRAGLKELADNIFLHLLDGDPPLLRSRILSSLLEADIGSLRGRAIKNHEDRVDALLCAYMASYYARWRKRRCRVYGDVDTGYILCPIPPSPALS